MNKLTEPIYKPTSWGSEIIYTITDHYICKTIEIEAGKITDLIVFEKKEKSILVVSGILSLARGKCCNEKDLKYYECPEGWSVYIAPGIMHRYGATNKPVRLIETASPQLDEAIIIGELEELYINGN